MVWALFSSPQKLSKIYNVDKVKIRRDSKDVVESVSDPASGASFGINSQIRSQGEDHCPGTKFLGP